MNPRTLWTLTVPMRRSAQRSDGALAPDATRAVEARLLAKFGGYTAVTVTGAWINCATDEVETDDSTRFEVATDWQIHPNAYDTMYALAAATCKRLAQDCVMLTRQDHRGYAVEYVEG